MKKDNDGLAPDGAVLATIPPPGTGLPQVWPKWTPESCKKPDDLYKLPAGKIRSVAK